MWRIETTDTFDEWFNALDDADRARVLAMLLFLREHGPTLSRPYADRLKGSRFLNMKELRIQCGGQPLRAFFAFDAHRTGVLLCGGNKASDEKRFYEVMLRVADQEFTDYLDQIKEKE